MDKINKSFDTPDFLNVFNPQSILPVCGNKIAHKADRPFLGNLEDGQKFSYEWLSRVGVVIAFDKKFNRDVSKYHVRSLKDDIKKVGCLEPIKVFRSEVYLAESQDAELVTIDGTPVIQSEDQITLVVGDGQHRFHAYTELKNEDFKFEESIFIELVKLKEGVTPLNWILSINNTSRGWKSEDRAKCIMAKQSDSEETNISLSKEWKEKHGIGERHAYAILNVKEVKIKELYLACMNDKDFTLPSQLRGIPENIERGKRILNAFLTCFRNQKNMLKNMSAIKAFIEAYDQYGDSGKEKAVEELIIFFTSYDCTPLSKIDKGEVKSRILSDWKTFKEEYQTPDTRVKYQLKAKEAEKEYQSMLDNEAESKSKTN